MLKALLDKHLYNLVVLPMASNWTITLINKVPDIIYIVYNSRLLVKSQCNISLVCKIESEIICKILKKLLFDFILNQYHSFY